MLGKLFCSTEWPILGRTCKSERGLFLFFHIHVCVSIHRSTIYSCSTPVFQKKSMNNHTTNTLILITLTNCNYQWNTPTYTNYACTLIIRSSELSVLIDLTTLFGDILCAFKRVVLFTSTKQGTPSNENVVDRSNFLAASRRTLGNWWDLVELDEAWWVMRLGLLFSVPMTQWVLLMVTVGKPLSAPSKEQARMKFEEQKNIPWWDGTARDSGRLSTSRSSPTKGRNALPQPFPGVVVSFPEYKQPKERQ